MQALAWAAPSHPEVTDSGGGHCHCPPAPDSLVFLHGQLYDPGPPFPAVSGSHVWYEWAAH